MEIERLSYSKFSTYSTCPESFRLTVVEELPDSVGWYHIGGTAVHLMTEAEDLARFTGERVESFNYYFDKALAEQQELTPTILPEQYLTTGRGAAVENEQWWRNAGPGLVATWRRWLNASPYMIWVTPDGEPAVEVEMDSMFGEVPSKAFIDRILIHVEADWSDPRVPLLVTDIKNGKPPKDKKQLVAYGEACQQRGWNATHGGYFMTKGGILTGLHDLGEMMGPQITYEYEQAWRGIKNKVFPARPSGLCKNWCGVNKFCAWGGELEDRSHLPYEDH